MSSVVKKPDAELPPGRAALFVAHPGHELSVHAWLERARPTVFVLTDGSGKTGKPRLALTTALLARAGARPGSVYGHFSDAALYETVLERRDDLFLELVEELADALVHDRITYLVADMADGYNPSHDLCRVLADAALELAWRTTGVRIASYALPLLEQLATVPAEGEAACVRLHLSEAEFARKLDAARSYTPLRAELETLFQTGVDSFRTERLWPTPRGVGRHLTPSAPPLYERHGERRVADGHYPQVLRYREHLFPLIERLADHVENSLVPESAALARVDLHPC